MSRPTTGRSQPSRSSAALRSRSRTRSKEGAPARLLGQAPPPADREETTTLVGAMLREQRRRLNLTLQDVAERAGITKGFLSEVERDRAAPSVATLLRLRDALSLSVSSLFRSSLPQVVRRSERQVVPYGGQGINCSLLSARNAHRLMVAHAEFKPGGESGSEPHTMDSDEEIIVVLSGTLEISVQNETHTLRAGDSITFDPRSPHIYRNPSNREAARTLCIMAPPPK